MDRMTSATFDTGFSAPGGLATKRRMLELEGAPGHGQQALLG